MAKYYEFRDIESRQLRVCEAWGLKDPVNGSTALKQAEKALEEVGELLTALGALNAYKELIRAFPDVAVRPEFIDGYKRAWADVRDAIGDSQVCLVNVCDQLDVDLVHDCYGPAVDVISKRTGKMVKGKFVKDA